MLKECLGDLAKTEEGKAFEQAKNNLMLVNGLLY